MGQVKENKQQDEAQWDKMKIIAFCIFIVVLLVAGLLLKDSILGKPYTSPNVTQKINSVIPKIDVKKTVQDQINALQQEADNINLADMATSSPQVQKVINDLKALKDLPNNQLKQACLNICKKL
jgi:hypothetical protein